MEVRRDLSSGAEPVTSLLPREGTVTYTPGFLPPPVADATLLRLRDELDWRAESARFFGRAVALPRLTAWYGPVPYAYSGVFHDAAAPPPLLAQLAQDLAALAPGLDCVLANRYRSGADKMGLHADDEALWGANPTIVSLSFGAARRFVFRHRRSRERVEIVLEHGSLLLMGGETQRHWLHAVPGTARPVGERINLTFRRLALR
jgi:alkylated DNA repair dioxygenase AlkB